MKSQTTTPPQPSPSAKGRGSRRSLFDAARACLDAASPEAKLESTFEAAQAFERGELAIPIDAP
ncbi:MAG TPA: hypothetical protein VFQ84_06515, partial [Arenimonas sp.]|nr:hypothetical protein [Arenimonas sp.]